MFALQCGIDIFDLAGTACPTPAVNIYFFFFVFNVSANS
jgi:hypothetical protein